MRVGVAVADKPYGPFKPLANFIGGVSGIDPSVLIDKDGSAYIYYAMASKVFVARLKPNMVEIEGEPQAIDSLPTKGLVEGPFVFERKGTYYLTYPHVENKVERLEYATSHSPLGPFKPIGVILDESSSGCWTVHHSILDYQGQSYLFYHDRDLSPSFDKNRSIRADRLYFNADGTIRKVIPTLRGVGVVQANSEVQIDRYSATSSAGIAVSFLDETNPHAGWKTTFNAAKSWLRFDQVDFGRGGNRSIEVRAKAAAGGLLEIRLKQDGPVVGRVAVAAKADWGIASVAVKGIPAGIHDMVVTQAGSEAVEVDWVRFR
jgi:hypothetical protein